MPGYLFLTENVRSTAKKNAPASCSLLDAFASRLSAIFLLYFRLKDSSSPRKPGMRKSNSDHSSKTWFWMGVPLRISRC
jgi:hypothetical protein